MGLKEEWRALVVGERRTQKILDAAEEAYEKAKKEYYARREDHARAWNTLQDFRFNHRGGRAMQEKWIQETVAADMKQREKEKWLKIKAEKGGITV